MLVPICVCVVIWDGCYAKLTNINSRHHNIECFKIFTFSQGQILVQSRNIIQHLTRLGTCILWIWHLVYNPPNLTPQFAFLNFNKSVCLLRIWPLIWVRIKVKQLNKIQGKNQLTISLLKNKRLLVKQAKASYILSKPPRNHTEGVSGLAWDFPLHLLFVGASWEVQHQQLCQEYHISFHV